MAILSPTTAAVSRSTSAFPVTIINGKGSSLSSPINLRRPFLPPPIAAPTLRLSRLLPATAALPPPPPPQSDPPPDKNPFRPKGVMASISQFQDRVQIFMAVLFWMSLFFWSSAWDGGNRGRGKPNKGSRFRR